MVGKAAVPERSPANCNFPLVIASASATLASVMAAVTKEVVASFVELSPVACLTPIVPVGSVGVPVKEGETKGAFKSKAL